MAVNAIYGITHVQTPAPFRKIHINVNGIIWRKHQKQLNLYTANSYPV